MRALNLIRSAPEYRATAFNDGLRAAGYRLHSEIRDPGPGDVVVIWNRYGRFHQEALRFEKEGAAVIVVENGYMDRRRTGWHDRHVYAMALHWHNGFGRWPGNGIEVDFKTAARRLDSLDLAPMRPWQETGTHVLICGQRSIGIPPMQSPPGWEEDVAERLARLTDREIRIRRHPGNTDPETPVDVDLAGAWACVVWSSNCATRALMMGIPVFYEAPAIVTRAACARGIAAIEQPKRAERPQAFVDLAWAQWSVEEITSGLPFRVLLDGTRRPSDGRCAGLAA